MKPRARRMALAGAVAAAVGVAATPAQAVQMFLKFGPAAIGFDFGKKKDQAQQQAQPQPANPGGWYPLNNFAWGGMQDPAAAGQQPYPQQQQQQGYPQDPYAQQQQQQVYAQQQYPQQQGYPQDPYAQQQQQQVYAQQQYPQQQYPQDPYAQQQQQQVYAQQQYPQQQYPQQQYQQQPVQQQQAPVQQPAQQQAAAQQPQAPAQQPAQPTAAQQQAAAQQTQPAAGYTDPAQQPVQTAAATDPVGTPEAGPGLASLTTSSPGAAEAISQACQAGEKISTITVRKLMPDGSYQDYEMKDVNIACGSPAAGGPGEITEMQPNDEVMLTFSNVRLVNEKKATRSKRSGARKSGR